jgi:hypothetical protein
LTGIDAVKGGISRGSYELEVRLRQTDEKPGATVRYADIRYASTGVEIIGLPKHSPLVGEASDREGDSAGTTTNNNDTFLTAQNLGNILANDRNTVSVGGFLAGATDVDWYRFNVDYDFVQSVVGLNNAGKSWSAIFDIDYADGLGRPDTMISIFDEFGRLILVGRDSNVDDDQQRKGDANAPLSERTIRGSFGKNDPYIGPVQLPTGTTNGAAAIPGANSSRTYYVAVSSSTAVPQMFDQFYTENPTNPLIRLEPVNSVNRVADDHIDYAGYAPIDPATGQPLYPNSPFNAPPHADAASRNPLFGPTNGIGRTISSLAAQATPFTIGDVPLFVIRDTDAGIGNDPANLLTVNPFTGAVQTFVGDVTVNRGIADLAARADGRLMAFTSGNNTGTIGNLVELNPGNAAVTNRGDDSDNIVPVVLGMPALAFRTLEINNEAGDQFSLYSVDYNNVYRIHERDTGAVPPPTGAIRQLGFVSQLTFSSTATGNQFRDGSAFSLTDPTQPGSPAQVFEFNNPLLISVDRVPNAGAPSNALGTRFTVTQGVQVVTVELNSTTDLNTVTTNLVTVGFASLAGNDTPANRRLLAARIASALGGLVGADDPTEVYLTNGANLNLQANANLSGDTTLGDATLIRPTATVINTWVNASGFLRFRTATEMQTEIIRAVNTAFSNPNASRELTGDFGVDFPRFPVVNLAPPPSDPTVTITLSNQFLNGEQVTGMAYRQLIDPGILYFVTNRGRFMTANANTGEILTITTVPGVTSFGGLANMPRNVEGAAFFDLFMAITEDGTLIALNEEGAPVRAGVDSTGVRRQIFYNGQDRVDISAFAGAGFTGLAFSTADYNLWHVTSQRGFDPGHGVSDAFDNSRNGDNLGNNPASPIGASNQQLGALSYRFAYDTPEEEDPNFFGDRVSNFADDYLRPYRFRQDVVDTYNVPGGAQGSLLSNEFSLEGYSSDDKPTLYFNYYLQTENALSHDPRFGGLDNAMRDSFRTFISDDGINWHQLTTNNQMVSNYYDPPAQLAPFGRRTAELPEGQFSSNSSQTWFPQGGEYLDNPHLNAGQDAQRRVQQTFDQPNPTFIDPDTDTQRRNFRQVRVDLGDFAGKKNLRLRFDFSTAGDMNEPAKLRVVIPNNDAGVRELNLLDGRTITVSNLSGAENFEVDTNGAASSPIFGGFFKQRVNFLPTTLPSDFFDGATFTLDGRTFEFDRDPGLLGNVTPGNIRVNISQSSVNGTVLGILRALGEALDEEFLLDVVQERGISGQISVIVKSTSTPTTTLNPARFAIDQVPIDVVFVGDANFDNTIDETDVAARIRDTVNYYSVTTGLTDFGARTVGLLGNVADNTLFRFEDTVQFLSPRQGERPNVSSNFQRGLITFNTSAGPSRWDVGGNGEYLPGDVLGNFEDTFKDIGKGLNNSFEGVYLDDIVIGFAERGEMVTRSLNVVASGEGTPTIFPDTPVFTPPPFDPNTFAARPNVTGAYQLEVRNGVTYGSLLYDFDLPAPTGSPIDPFPAPNLRLDRSFDTNDRQSTGFVINALPATAIADGSNFTINDGYRQVRYEFNKELAIQVTRIPNLAANAVPDIVLSFNSSANPTTPVTIELDTNNANNPTPANARANIADLSQNNLTSRQELARRIAAAINSVPGNSARSAGDTVYVTGGFNFSNVFDDQFPSTQPVLSRVTGWTNGRVPNSTTPGTIPTVPINLAFSDTAAEVADKIALAIRNSTTNGARLDVGASTLNLERDPQAPLPATAKVSLVGAQIIDQDPLLTRLEIVQFGRANLDARSNADGTMTHLGDSNRVREQGQVLIESTRVSQSPVGILVAASLTSAGASTVSTMNLPVRSLDNVTPGVVLLNNTIFNFTDAGIRLAGDTDLADSPQGAVPLARVINNTIVGGPIAVGIGIDVGRQRSAVDPTQFVNAPVAPTLVNNIVSNTLLGIRVEDSTDSTVKDSRGTSVLSANVFQGNTANVQFGQELPVSNANLTSVDPLGLIQAATLPLFIDIASGNFQLRRGTTTVANFAVDSANNAIDDRAGLAAIRQSIGWASSPILAPNVDQLGLIRQDDPNSPTPPGLGSNLVKDRGALERTDFFGPLAFLINPIDNGPLDSNSAINDVAVTGGIGVTKFEIQLRELVGVGVDDASVLPTSVIIRRNNGSPLVPGQDYVFVYDAERDIITLQSRGSQFPEGNYRIDLDNSVNGIRDRAGNPVLSNRVEGSLRPTSFNVAIDLTGPTGLISAPLDNGPQDTDPDPNELSIRTATGLAQFELTLQGGVGGIDDSTVDASKFTLRRDGVQLLLGQDYEFVYDPATDKVVVRSIGSLFVPGNYTLAVDNTANGVLDANGNPLQPNQVDGSTRYLLNLRLSGPTAALVTPLDNGPSDGNPLLNQAEVVSKTGLARIDVRLLPDTPGTTINDASVAVGKIKLFRGSDLLTLGTHYSYVYNSTTDTISLFLVGTQPVPAQYRVELDNSATGILDSAGGRLAPNQTDGKTQFSISVVPPGPVATLISPFDGGPADKDPDPDEVQIYTLVPVTRFDVLLRQVGFAVDDASVTADKVTLRRNGVSLVRGTDYEFTYTAATDIVRLTSVANEFTPGLYEIQLDNTPATGIRDLDGNPVRPNRVNGTTVLSVSFAPPSPIQLPQGIFVSNLGLSDIGGSTFVGFRIEGDPFTRVTVTVDSRSEPTGTVRSLLTTSVIVDQNGTIDFARAIPGSVNGETLLINVTSEFGETIAVTSLLGPRATSARAYTSALFNKLLRRDGRLTPTVDEFTPFEALGSNSNIAQAMITSDEFVNSATAALVQELLGRAPTAAELTTYGNQFRTTGSFDQARIAMLTSDEFARMPADRDLNFNNATHRQLVTDYVQRVYAKLLPGVTLTATELDGEVRDVFEAGRRWIITNTNATDGGIFASAAYRASRTNRAFQDCLGRNATPAEIASLGGLSDRELLRTIVVSGDFYFPRLAESIYREYLQRAPGATTAAEINALVTLLRGGASEAQVRARVIGSEEFKANAGGLLTGFVENAFRQILLRAPSSTEVANGVSFVNSNGGDTPAGREAYALLLFGNSEFSLNARGVAQTAPLQSADAAAPQIAAIAQVAAIEGSQVTRMIQATDTTNDPIAYRIVAAPSGATVDSSTGRFQWTPTDDFRGAVPVTIEAFEQGGSRLRTTRTFLIDVRNANPTASVVAPATVVGGQMASITLNATDPGLADQAANFRFEVDWNNDGRFDQTIIGRTGSTVQRLFTGGGQRSFTVRATDKDGGISQTTTGSVFIGGVFVETDPNNPSIRNLVVVSSEGDDSIRLEQVTGTNSVIVYTNVLNGQIVNQVQRFDNITGIISVAAGGGNDTVVADQVTNIRLSIDGGAGNDSLCAGMANDTILGGDGIDTIWGMRGNDSIDGGAGADLLFGDVPNTGAFSIARSTLGRDTIRGGAGNDTIYGDSDGGEGASDWIDAGDGDDTVFGDGSVGSLLAGDTIFGGAGNDLLFGDHPEAPILGGGQDSVDGGSGNDIVYGGGGADFLTGGTGSDLIIADMTSGWLNLSTYVNVQREWVSGAATNVRRDRIRAVRFDGANNFNFIVPSNVLDDNQVDRVFAGDDGDGDWVLATQSEDQVSEIRVDDFLDVIPNQ